MEKINWNEIVEHKVIEGLFGKFFHTETMTVVQWRFEAGTSLPIHDHHHEQITMVVDGKLDLTIQNNTKTLISGDILLIPSGISHGGKSLENTTAIDIFHPVRMDFKEKYK
jgi:quercetin dioxygenase-like cupin family protein